jgi:hypothetical protein
MIVGELSKASVQAAIDQLMSGLPPSSCSTLGSLDFMRVPKPAARITARGFIAYLLLFAAGMSAFLKRRRKAPDWLEAYAYVIWEGLLLWIRSK